MKSRFSTIDIKATIKELQKYISLRVVNVYDIDNKTYLIKLSKFVVFALTNNRPDTKAVILIESAIRIHSTDFDWPKNPAPSGFSMKLRKHVKGRRLEKIEQLGVDRIIDLQFGSGDAAYHVVVELYDRGNIVLTDSNYLILNILRPRTDDSQSQDVKFSVRETYPVHMAKQYTPPTRQTLEEAILSAKEGDVLKRVLMTSLAFGPALIEHCLLGVGLKETMKVTPHFTTSPEMDLLMEAVEEGQTIYEQLSTTEPKGYIIQKSEKRVQAVGGDSEELLTYQDYHPWMFRQHSHTQYIELDSFSQAVDEFYSKMESQKLDMKVLHQEKSALKKLENVKKDHERRIEELQREQDLDIRKGELIEMNRSLVDNAISVVRSALANQIDWSEIRHIVDEAQSQGDEVARAIRELRLNTNHITMALREPYEISIGDEGVPLKSKPTVVEIDLGLGAYGNSRRYFDKKKAAAKKEQKTVESSSKALKSAEKKTQQTLKDVATAATINKARKTFWFEKFLWFISSENYLVVSGRDQQQNELIVKRYLRPGDVYVHADLHGAASVIVKNHIGGDIPPKTLNEAGTMAICHSAAWDAKVVTSAWYVHHDQVSKTAPTGEYLTTGSFMIRGKKNYLPPSYLIYGFALLFKLEEESIARHMGERRVRGVDEDAAVSVADDHLDTIDEVEMSGSDDDSDQSDPEQDAGRLPNTATEAHNEHNPAASIIVKTTTDPGMDDQPSSTASTKLQTECKTDAQSCMHLNELNTECELEPSPSNLTASSISLNDDIVQSKIHDIETCDVIDELVISHDRDSDGDSGDVSMDDGDDNDDAVVTRTAMVNVANTNSIVKSDDILTVTTSNDEADVQFPDTSIDLQHVKGSKFCLQRSTSTQSTLTDTSSQTPTDTSSAANSKRLSAKQRRDLKKKNKGESALEPQPMKETVDKQNVNKDAGQQMPKRGQKSKQKKVKQKYGDQDDEERQLRMEILASAGAQREKKKSKLKVKQHHQNVKKVGQYRGGQGLVLHDDSAPVERQEVDVEVDDDDDKQDDEKQPDSMTTLNSLTGQPTIEDELLFAVPVCAPYQALTNYKYKVKLMPGSTKRGKASKLAMAMFVRDKTATGREKDLIKILKDVDVARNIPGKVKITAPNLQKIKI